MTPWPVWQGFESTCLRNSFEIEPWKSSYSLLTLPLWFMDVDSRLWSVCGGNTSCNGLQWFMLMQVLLFLIGRIVAIWCLSHSRSRQQIQQVNKHTSGNVRMVAPPFPLPLPLPLPPSARNTWTQHTALPHCCHWIHCQHDAGSLLFGQTGSARVWIITASVCCCLSFLPSSPFISWFCLNLSSWLWPDCMMNRLAKTQPSPPCSQSQQHEQVLCWKCWVITSVSSIWERESCAVLTFERLDTLSGTWTDISL